MLALRRSKTSPAHLLSASQGLHSQSSSLPQNSEKLTQQRTYNSINCDTPFNLCFLRHGQSTWNRDNRFIGWTDTPLTDDGVLEARVAGQMLHKSGILFDEVHTSLLRRSIRTTNLVLMEMDRSTFQFTRAGDSMNATTVALWGSRRRKRSSNTERTK